MSTASALRAQAQVRIEVVRDLETLDALEPAWRRLDASDPEATAFLSWPWIRGRLQALSSPWEVLVAHAQPEGRIVGLFPLRQLRSGGAWGMAGSPLADTTGMLCACEAEAPVLAAVVAHLSGQPRPLTFADVHDRRIEALLRHLGEEGYAVSSRPGVPCPRLSLPESWQGFLGTQLSASRRATVRRKLRTFEQLPGLRRTSIEEGGSRSLDALLQLWQSRWGFLAPEDLAEYRAVFEACLREGTLWLDLFWQEETPVTGLLAFLDPQRSWFGFYITGFDARYARYSPGTVIVAHALRRALEAGFRTFDFLRGDEPYKRSFGATPRRGIDATATWVPARDSPPSRKLSQRVPARAAATSR